jgi:hypothetical protein
VSALILVWMCWWVMGCRKMPTGPTPGSAGPVNAPTLNSSIGASCTKSRSAHAASADSSKPSTCYRTTKTPQDESLMASAGPLKTSRVASRCALWQEVSLMLMLPQR